jgi:hypothetical protein
MGYKRIFIRVPLAAEATLSGERKKAIKARTVDISQGGFCISGPTEELSESEYQIEIITAAGDRLEMRARLVRREGDCAGFQTLQMDEHCVEVITYLVSEYQMTPEFIKQLDEFDLLSQRFVDDDGNELEITFDHDSDT